MATPLKSPLPDEIAIDGIHLSVAEMKELERITGQPIKDLFYADDDNTILTRFQAVGWAALRRAGYDPTWEEAETVRLYHEAK